MRANLAAEVRQAMLVTRGAQGAGSLSAREALRVATRGGAACLGRDDIGSIEVGKRADLALFPVDGLATAGADADPVAALALCRPERVRHLLVDGRVVVRDGTLATADESAIAGQGHRTARGRSRERSGDEPAGRTCGPGFRAGSAPPFAGPTACRR